MHLRFAERRAAAGRIGSRAGQSAVTTDLALHFLRARSLRSGQEWLRGVIVTDERLHYCSATLSGAFGPGRPKKAAENTYRECDQRRDVERQHESSPHPFGCW